MSAITTRGLIDGGGGGGGRNYEIRTVQEYYQIVFVNDI